MNHLKLLHLSEDDDVDLAFNKLLSLVLELPREKRYDFLKRANTLYLSERKRLRAANGLKDGRGSVWQNPEKRAQIVTKMRQTRSRQARIRAEAAGRPAPPGKPVVVKD